MGADSTCAKVLQDYSCLGLEVKYKHDYFLLIADRKCQ